MARNYRIAVIGGDGIGPEVVREGLRVLERVASVHGFRVTPDALSVRRRALPEDEGNLSRDAAFSEVRGHDAILLGAIGDPRIEVGPARVRHHRQDALRARPVREPAPGAAVRRAPVPAQGHHAGRRELHRGAREHRGRLRRHARLLQEGHARRGRDAGDHLHAQGRRARDPLRVRAGAQAQSREEAHADRQGERGARHGSVDAHVRRGGRRVSRTSRAITSTSTPRACTWCAIRISTTRW